MRALVGLVLFVFAGCATAQEAKQKVEQVRAAIADTGVNLERARVLLDGLCVHPPPEAPAPKECPELEKLFEALRGTYTVINDNAPQ